MQDIAIINSNSTLDSVKPSKRNLAFTLAVGAFLLGFVASAFAQSTDDLFEHYEFVTDITNRQTVVAGFFLESATAEIAVVYIDESNNPHGKMYGFDGDGWVLLSNQTLSSEIQFVDVANIGGRDRLITYQPGRLSWFDPESATERDLVSVTSNFMRPQVDQIPHVDVSQDLNGGELDDLVVPDVDGFWVFVQTSDGAFADAVKIGSPTDLSRIYGADGYRYNPWSQSRVHNMDYNHDGSSDLVFWSEDHFEVQLQDESGQFASITEIFTTDVAFDSDKLDSLASADLTGRVLHSLADMNGDGIGDLVVTSLEGERISEKRSTYEVYFGARTPDGGTAFASEVGITFRSEGSIHLGMDRHDFDGDGQVDLMFTTIGVKYLTSSFWKRWAGFWGQDIWLDLEFYRMDGGRYPNTPNASRWISLVARPSKPGWVPLDFVLRGGTHESRKTQVRTIDLEGGFAAVMEDWQRLSEVSSSNYPPAFNMILQIGDVTGDGHAELFIGKNTPEGLDVFFGVPGPDLFARRSREVAATVPDDEEYTWLVDLNKDGKQDILMHHPFTLKDSGGFPTQPPGTEPHRVTTLIAR